MWGLVSSLAAVQREEWSEVEATLALVKGSRNRQDGRTSFLSMPLVTLLFVGEQINVLS